MLAFNTDRLTSGKQQVDALFENADFHGYELIRLVLNKVSDPDAAVTQPIGGFQRLNEHGDLDFGNTYFYPDQKGRSWLFLVNTEHNRHYLKHSMADTMFSIVDQKVKAELIKECEAEGIRTEPRQIDLGFDTFTTKEKQLNTSLESKIDEVAELRAKLAEANTAKAALEIEKQDAEKALESAKVPTEVVTQVALSESSDELVEEKVVAQPDIKPKAPAKKKVTSKVKAKK
jgi:hypothetical protein